MRMMTKKREAAIVKVRWSYNTCRVVNEKNCANSAPPPKESVSTHQLSKRRCTVCIRDLVRVDLGEKVK